jgi:hypothetical protein
MLSMALSHDDKFLIKKSKEVIKRELEKKFVSSAVAARPFTDNLNEEKTKNPECLGMISGTGGGCHI